MPILFGDFVVFFRPRNLTQFLFRISCRRWSSRSERSWWIAVFDDFIKVGGLNLKMSKPNFFVKKSHLPFLQKSTSLLFHSFFGEGLFHVVPAAIFFWCPITCSPRSPRRNVTRIVLILIFVLGVKSFRAWPLFFVILQVYSWKIQRDANKKMARMKVGTLDIPQSAKTMYHDPTQSWMMVLGKLLHWSLQRWSSNLTCAYFAHWVKINHQLVV